MGKAYFKQIIFGTLILFLLLSIIQPVYPRQMFLQHSATLILFAFFLADIRKNYISNQSFLCLALMIALHILGARWIYSYVPYDQWFTIISGHSISSLFGFERNHYDRFVHFMYGFLILLPAAEVYQKWFGLRKGASFHIAILFVMASSMFYELFEYGIALSLSPESAEDYNGQQGDMWDAQKDMALAFAGAILQYLLIKNTKLTHNLK